MTALRPEELEHDFPGYAFRFMEKRRLVPRSDMTPCRLLPPMLLTPHSTSVDRHDEPTQIPCAPKNHRSLHTIKWREHGQSPSGREISWATSPSFQAFAVLALSDARVRKARHPGHFPFLAGSGGAARCRPALACTIPTRTSTVFLVFFRCRSLVCLSQDWVLPNDLKCDLSERLNRSAGTWQNQASDDCAVKASGRLLHCGSYCQSCSRLYYPYMTIRFKITHFHLASPTNRVGRHIDP